MASSHFPERHPSQSPQEETATPLGIRNPLLPPTPLGGQNSSPAFRLGTRSLCVLAPLSTAGSPLQDNPASTSVLQPLSDRAVPTTQLFPEAKGNPAAVVEGADTALGVARSTKASPTARNIVVPPDSTGNQERISRQTVGESGEPSPPPQRNLIPPETSASPSLQAKIQTPAANSPENATDSEIGASTSCSEGIQAAEKPSASSTPSAAKLPSESRTQAEHSIRGSQSPEDISPAVERSDLKNDPTHSNSQSISDTDVARELTGGTASSDRTVQAKSDPSRLATDPAENNPIQRIAESGSTSSPVLPSTPISSNSSEADSSNATQISGVRAGDLDSTPPQKPTAPNTLASSQKGVTPPPTTIGEGLRSPANPSLPANNQGSAPQAPANASEPPSPVTPTIQKQHSPSPPPAAAQSKPDNPTVDGTTAVTPNTTTQPSSERSQDNIDAPPANRLQARFAEPPSQEDPPSSPVQPISPDRSSGKERSQSSTSGSAASSAGVPVRNPEVSSPSIGQVESERLQKQDLSPPTPNIQLSGDPGKTPPLDPKSNRASVDRQTTDTTVNSSVDENAATMAGDRPLQEVEQSDGSRSDVGGLGNSPSPEPSQAPTPTEESRSFTTLDGDSNVPAIQAASQADNSIPTNSLAQTSPRQTRSQAESERGDRSNPSDPASIPIQHPPSSQISPAGLSEPPPTQSHGGGSQKIANRPAQPSTSSSGIQRSPETTSAIPPAPQTETETATAPVRSSSAEIKRSPETKLESSSATPTEIEISPALSSSSEIQRSPETNLATSSAAQTETAISPGQSSTAPIGIQRLPGAESATSPVTQIETETSTEQSSTSSTEAPQSSLAEPTIPPTTQIKTTTSPAQSSITPNEIQRSPETKSTAPLATSTEPANLPGQSSTAPSEIQRSTQTESATSPTAQTETASSPAQSTTAPREIQRSPESKSSTSKTDPAETPTSPVQSSTAPSEIQRSPGTESATSPVVQIKTETSTGQSSTALPEVQRSPGAESETSPAVQIETSTSTARSSTALPEVQRSPEAEPATPPAAQIETTTSSSQSAAAPSEIQRLPGAESATSPASQIETATSPAQFSTTEIQRSPETKSATSPTVQSETSTSPAQFSTAEIQRSPETKSATLNTDLAETATSSADSTTPSSEIQRSPEAESATSPAAQIETATSPARSSIALPEVQRSPDTKSSNTDPAETAISSAQSTTPFSEIHRSPETKSESSLANEIETATSSAQSTSPSSEIKQSPETNSAIPPASRSETVISAAQSSTSPAEVQRAATTDPTIPPAAQTEAAAISPEQSSTLPAEVQRRTTAESAISSADQPRNLDSRTPIPTTSQTPPETAYPSSDSNPDLESDSQTPSIQASLASIDGNQSSTVSTSQTTDLPVRSIPTNTYELPLSTQSPIPQEPEEDNLSNLTDPASSPIQRSPSTQGVPADGSQLPITQSPSETEDEPGNPLSIFTTSGESGHLSTTDPSTLNSPTPPSVPDIQSASLSAESVSLQPAGLDSKLGDLPVPDRESTSSGSAIDREIQTYRIETDGAQQDRTTPVNDPQPGKEIDLPPSPVSPWLQHQPAGDLQTQQFLQPDESIQPPPGDNRAPISPIASKAKQHQTRAHPDRPSESLSQLTSTPLQQKVGDPPLAPVELPQTQKDRPSTPATISPDPLSPQDRQLPDSTSPYPDPVESVIQKSAIAPSPLQPQSLPPTEVPSATTPANLQRSDLFSSTESLSALQTQQPIGQQAAIPQLPRVLQTLNVLQPLIQPSSTPQISGSSRADVQTQTPTAADSLPRSPVPQANPVATLNDLANNSDPGNGAGTASPPIQRYAQQTSSSLPEQWSGLAELVSATAIALQSSSPIPHRPSNGKTPIQARFEPVGEVSSNTSSSTPEWDEVLQISSEETTDPEQLNAYIDTLAREVYNMLRLRLERDRERHGNSYTGRLPW